MALPGAHCIAVAASLAVLGAAQYFTITKTVYTPHLNARIPYLPPRLYPGGIMARITAIYEVDTQDFKAMQATVRERISVALEGIPLQYFEVEDYKWLTAGARCTPGILTCRATGDLPPALPAPGIGGGIPGAYKGSMEAVDARSCKASSGVVPDSPGSAVLTGGVSPPMKFDPQWKDGNADALDKLVNQMQFCVNKANSSLMYYPIVLTNVFITGWRDSKNKILYSNPAENVGIQLWVVGVIPVTWAKYLNRKFVMNGSIPLPLYQPEVVDRRANFTDNLNVSLQVLGVRLVARPPEQGGDIIQATIPVCQDPKISAAGCVRITTAYYFHPALPQYKVYSYVLWRKLNFTMLASDQPYPFGEFNISQGPWPVVDWVGGDSTKDQQGPWSQRTFPQKESVQQTDCYQGKPCAQVPHAPSPRHLHSAVLYTTWSFKEQAWRYLCNERPECGTDCLTNLTCLGGVSYFQDNFFFRSSTFKNDDGGIVPAYTLQNQDCPDGCCRDRRLCMRVNDVLGYEVPFESETMLVFGGKTYGHVKDPATGKLIYHNCEQIPKQSLRPEWKSCMEVVAADLWRYDILRGKWEYIKPASAMSSTTGQPVGYPLARYGHGAVVIESVDGNDASFKRYYMYIYGGLGPQCPGGGVCNDVWTYEIPWAAQAYYPKFPDGDWTRGNQWNKLKDCPFGGRYRHAMVATSGMEYIYVFGGQIIGEFTSTLLRYRISTDVWEDLDPFGRISLTRLMYDFNGKQVIRQVPLAEYNSDVDVDCSIAWRFDGKWAHCAVCPQCRLATGTRDKGSILPEERGDSVMVAFFDPTPGAVDDAIALFGGYRTTWGTLRDPVGECKAAAAAVTTTTAYPAHTADEDIVLTEPVTTVVRATTTTVPARTGISVVGTFTPVGRTATTTSTVTYLWTSTFTTTELLRLETKTSTTSTTQTSRTSTTSSSTRTTTTTITGSTPRPTTTTTAYQPQTMPPVVAGSAIKNFNMSLAGTSQSGGKTGSSRVGPEVCTSTYYFNDLWKYEATTNQFARQDTQGALPSARKGHRIIARRARTNDTQLLLFGGHRQDVPVNDMWILNLLRTGEERTWARIDPYIIGQKPPPMSYHSMLYSERLDQIIVFGGLSWKETDLSRSDALRNVDRRCLKKAQGMINEEANKSEAAFVKGLLKSCLDEQVHFCCPLARLANASTLPVYFGSTRIRTVAGALNLTALSIVCRKDCQEKAFYAEFYPIMSEGIWIFRTDSCISNCSGHGYCDASQCVCEPDWYGIDCSQRRCPGSPCYTDPRTKEQFCVECSTHGRCINGKCQCFPGWGFEDCSAVLCESNCSSTPTQTQGICVEDFPVHQCVCQGRWSGRKCDQLLCLNGCSGRGKCQADGTCLCDDSYYGEDCSLWTLTIA